MEPNYLRDAIAAAIHVTRGDDLHDLPMIVEPYQLTADQRNLLAAALMLIKEGRGRDETLAMLEQLARRSAGRP